MNTVINDGFMNPDRFSVSKHTSFKIGTKDPDPRPDIPQWRINRTNARSRGDRTFEHSIECKCGSTIRRVYDNKCYPCWKENKK